MVEAVSRQIDNSLSRSDVEFLHGYGYQIWMLRDGGFAFNGMGSQLALCMPANDMILVTTADNQAINNGPGYIAGAYYNLIAKTSENALPEDKDAEAALKQKTASLAIPLPQGEKTTVKAALYSGKRYVMQKNQMGIEWMSVDIAPELCAVRYANATGEHRIEFGMGGYTAQKFPEKYYGMTIGTKDMNYESIAAGAWVNECALICTLYAIDIHVGTLNMQLNFAEDSLSVYMDRAAEWFFEEYEGYATGYCG